jgi:PAS domain S-box-containing protein
MAVGHAMSHAGVAWQGLMVKRGEGGSEASARAGNIAGFSVSAAEILDNFDDAFCAVDRDWHVIYLNRAGETLWNRSRAEVLGEIFDNAFPSWGGTEARQALVQAMEEKKPVRLETSVGDVSVRINMVPADWGLTIHCRDISRKLRTEMELRERNDILMLAEQSAGIGVWDVDLATDTVRATPQFFRIMGLEPDTGSVAVERLRALRHPGDREAVVQGFRDALTNGRDAYESEYRIIRPDGQTRWIFGRGRVIRDALGIPVRYSGIDIDITDRKEAEGQRDLLVAELNHRVKNTLATVVAIAQQSFSKSATVENALETFNSRIQALAQTHTRLAERHWAGVSFETLLRDELTPYLQSDRSNAHVEGPALSVAPKSAILLGMIFHELATNAAKYGALSVKQGRVDVTWEVGDGAMRVTWRESGGPTVTAPTRRGFGRLLMERAVASDLKGKVDLDFAPEGLTCTISFPLSEYVTSGS